MNNRIYMATTVLFRMGVGFAVFAILARSLGPHQYGLFSTVFTAAGIAGILTDFGFGLKTLRDIAAEPDRGGELMGSALAVKAFLTAAVATIGGAAISLLQLDTAAKLAAMMIAAGVLIGAFGDLSLVAFRSIGRFAGETWIVVWTSAFYGFLLCATALLHGGLMLISAGFLFSRTLYAVVALLSVRALFPRRRPRRLEAVFILKSLRGSVSWAVDGGLVFINGQVDGLVVAQALGLAEAGLYQAASRFVQAALGLSAILLNIHIPRVAADAAPHIRRQRQHRMMLEFLAFGGAFGALLILGGPYLTHYVLGPGYARADKLWPGFAAFLLTRYIAAAFGSALSAYAKPLLRVAGQVTGLAVITIGFTIGLPRFGVISVPWTMAAGAMATTAVYAVWYRLLAKSDEMR